MKCHFVSLWKDAFWKNIYELSAKLAVIVLEEKIHLFGTQRHHFDNAVQLYAPPRQSLAKTLP